MFDFSLKDLRVIKTSTINYIDPAENVIININQNIHESKDDPSEVTFYMSFELIPTAEADEANKTFYVYVKVGGKYHIDYNNTPTDEELGQQLSKDLFPFLRSTVSTVMTSAGMQPFIMSVSILESDDN